MAQRRVVAQDERAHGGVRYPRMGAPERIDADVAVVGAGVAGLYAALTAAEAGARVAVISATPLAQTASYWAQGGLAAALAMDDSPQLHLEDTEARGARARAPLRRRGADERGAGDDPRAAAQGRRRSTPTATATWRSASRAATRAGGSCTPADRRRAGASRAQLSAVLVAQPGRAGPGDDARGGPLARGRARRRASCARTARPSGRAGRSSPPAAPPRCGGGRPILRARSASACCSPSAPGRRSPTSSSSSSTRPP